MLYHNLLLFNKYEKSLCLAQADFCEEVSQIFLPKGIGCGAVVELTPQNQEVMGSPVECWGCSSSLFIIISVSSNRFSLKNFPWRICKKCFINKNIGSYVRMIKALIVRYQIQKNQISYVGMLPLYSFFWYIKKTNFTFNFKTLITNKQSPNYFYHYEPLKKLPSP